MEKTITYHEKPGGENTADTLELAKKRAEELGIKTVLVASTIGDTAVKAATVFKGYNYVVVTHTEGFKEPDTQEFTEENRKAVEAAGGKVLTTTHALGGINRVLNKPGVMQHNYVIGDLIANALRMFGQGTKVACEIAAMAADCGLVRTDEEVISIGGTGRGADTALVLQPNYANRFFAMKIKEIVCKPRL